MSFTSVGNNLRGIFGLSAKTWIFIFALWVFVSAFNLTKAVHMDDPVYLYGARSVAQNPFQPYAGTLSWNHAYYGSMSSIAQPPLTFYGLGAVIRIFGESEIALHLYQSLFSLLAILFFYQLASRIGIQKLRTATCIFGASAAVVPSQNLMTDLPLLTFSLFCVLSLVSWNIISNSNFTSSARFLLLASLAATAACLTKYLGSVMFPLLILALLFKSPKNNRVNKVAILIPAAVLIGWCLFTYFQYGKLHFIQSNITEAGKRFWLNATDWMICLGAIVPFSFVFIPFWLRRRVGQTALEAFVIAMIFWQPDSLESALQQYGSLKIAAHIFWANGLFVFVSVIFGLWDELQKAVLSQAADRKNCWAVFLFLWFIGGVLFILLFAKFLAIRHVLFIYPIVVLIAAKIGMDKYSWQGLPAIVVTACLASVLGISDFKYAEVYKFSAQKFADEYKSRKHLWVLGAWGWQWYAEKLGMKAYAWDAPLRDGDIVIKASIPSNAGFSPEHESRLFEIEHVSVEPDTSTLIRTMSEDPWGGFYASRDVSIPWRISREPLDTFTAFEYRSSGSGIPELPLRASFGDELPPWLALSGFQPKEEWGRWSKAKVATLRFSENLPSSFLLIIEAKAFGPNIKAPASIRIGKFEGKLELGDVFTEHKLKVSEASGNLLEIEAAFAPVSPKDLSGSPDIRELGIAISSIRILDDGVGG